MVETSASMMTSRCIALLYNTAKHRTCILGFRRRLASIWFPCWWHLPHFLIYGCRIHPPLSFGGFCHLSFAGVGSWGPRVVRTLCLVMDQ